MPDPYHPALDEFVFEEHEQAAITSALATEKPWNWAPGGNDEATIKAVKVKIRQLHMQRHGSRCCYCRKNLHGGGHFVIDRDHVLPKSVEAYRPLAFSLWNIGVSCKRCNMQYKKNRVDFVIDQADLAALTDSTNYLLIHPNFDCYKDHISYLSKQDDDITIVKYTKVEGSEKGKFTFEFFNLKELEIGSHDEAQGRSTEHDLGPIATQARAAALAHGQ